MAEGVENARKIALGINYLTVIVSAGINVVKSFGNDGLLNTGLLVINVLCLVFSLVSLLLTVFYDWFINRCGTKEERESTATCLTGWIIIFSLCALALTSISDGLYSNNKEINTSG